MASSIENYLENLPNDRRKGLAQLRETLKAHLPQGFQEIISENSVEYVVPHTAFPEGYHCDPDKPLPFISLTNTKGHMALHHMGLYAMPELLDWFTENYDGKTKLNMGKGCVRFKKEPHIPYEFIGKLAEKVTPAEWVAFYESKVKR